MRRATDVPLVGRLHFNLSVHVFRLARYLVSRFAPLAHMGRACLPAWRVIFASIGGPVWLVLHGRFLLPQRLLLANALDFILGPGHREVIVVARVALHELTRTLLAAPDRRLLFVGSACLTRMVASHVHLHLFHLAFQLHDGLHHGHLVRGVLLLLRRHAPLQLVDLVPKLRVLLDQSLARLALVLVLGVGGDAMRARESLHLLKQNPVK